MVYSVVGVTLFCSVFYSCWLHFSGEVLFSTFFFLILSFIDSVFTPFLSCYKMG